MRKIRLFKPYVSWRARLYALRVLMGTQLAEGPMVKQFEYEFGKTFDKDHVVALNSGTSALELAYELCDIKPGDEVITPILTCTATNLPLLHRKAKIVFADIDTDLNISIEDVARKITPKTKAIVFVHFGGNNRGLRQLLVLARERNIRVIEDAAQAVGSAFWGHADFTAVSLQAIKTLTAGDGGMLIVKDADLFQKARRLRWFGYDRDEKQKKGDTDLTEAGYKYHMNDISAAIGLGNLRSLASNINRRQRVQDMYRTWDPKKNLIHTSPWLTLLIHPRAMQIQEKLRSEGIDCGQYHYRNDKYTVFGGRNYTNEAFLGEDHQVHLTSTVPTMNLMESMYLLLPYHQDITQDDVNRTMKIILEML